MGVAVAWDAEPSGDPYAETRARFEQLLRMARSRETQRMSHSEWERLLAEEGQELMRQLCHDRVEKGYAMAGSSCCSFRIRSVWNGWTWRNARIWARGSGRWPGRNGLRIGVHSGACTVVECGWLARVVYDSSDLCTTDEATAPWDMTGGLS